MLIGVFDLYKTNTQIKNGHFVVYIGVSVQPNQFLSKYGLRTIFFEKKRMCKGGAKADAVFCKPYRPNKITALEQNNRQDTL
jgi:hypothetical protein